MSKLHARIRGIGGNQSQAMGDYHPWGTEATPQVMAVTAVRYYDGGATVERLTPLVTANGAVIPASPPGRWGHTAPAGRP